PLAVITMKCLEIGVRRSYASAGEVERELQRFLNDEPVHAAYAGRPVVLWFAERRRLFQAGAVLLAIIAVLSVIATGLTLRREAYSVAEDALDKGTLRDVAARSEKFERLGAKIAPWLQPVANNVAEEGPAKERRLRACLGLLLAGDISHAGVLVGRLLEDGVSTSDFTTLCKAIHQQGLLPLDELRKQVGTGNERQRFLALLALAHSSPEDLAAKEAGERLAKGMAEAEGEQQPDIRDLARPASQYLRAHLKALFEREGEAARIRDNAARARLSYDGDGPSLLADSVAGCSVAAFADFLGLVDKSKERQAVIAALVRITQLNADGVRRGEMRAGAVIALMRLKARAQAFAALSPYEPELATQFVHGSRSRGVFLSDLAEGMIAPGAGGDHLRYVLASAMGEYGEAEFKSLPVATRIKLEEKFDDCLASNDPGVRGMSEWLSRQGKLSTKPKAVTTKASEVVRVKGAELRMVRCEAGNFLMGSSEKEEQRSAREGRKPHRVTLSKPFRISDREVTWGLFKRAVDDTDAKRRIKFGGADDQRGEEYPVGHVTHEEAVAFCRWLTRETGLGETDQCYPDSEDAMGDRSREWYPERRGFRLPREAEWEYAARAGTTTAFGFGDDKRLLKHYGNHDDNESVRLPRPPGKMRPNRWGLFDMHGNVFERCQDWFGDYTATEAPDPEGPSVDTAKKKVRVSRGGAFYNTSRYARSAYRGDFDPPNARSLGIGFRVVQTVD
ncbi:MAG: formylglycine-generating enzyme family protein, partial [Gemmataceae bacterium]|nr:formylglycine-generating enzyme family protein [Gemmataceae bacterium]